MAKKEKAATPVMVELPKINIKEMIIRLVGDSALIVHKWSDKAKKEIKGKQEQKAKQAKGKRNPEQEYKDSFYMENGQYVYPTINFKKAAVNACSHVDGITKVLARGAFHVVSEFIPLEGKPNMREDMVRLGGMGSPADIRYRPEFKKWAVNLNVRFNVNVISPEQILNLFNTAGFAIGVGDWRPQRDGSFGMFHVATSEEI